MPKIVILGSRRFNPYEILITPSYYDFGHSEEAYRKAAEKFYPAIDRADLILVYAPDGIGEHTARDVAYAKKRGKPMVIYGRGLMRGEEEIRSWRDCLLTPGRVNADGKVWSSSLKRWIPMSSKQVIAVLDWVLEKDSVDSKLSQEVERSVEEVEARD